MWEISLAPPGGTSVVAMTPTMGAARRPEVKSSPPKEAVTAMVYRRVDSDLDRTIDGCLTDAGTHDLYWENPTSAFQKISSTIGPHSCLRRRVLRMPWRQDEPFFAEIWTLDVRYFAHRGRVRSQKRTMKTQIPTNPILPLRYHRDFPLAHQSISFAPFASSRLITLVLFCSLSFGLGCLMFSRFSR